VKEHRHILAALRSRNPEAARRAMDAHILSSSADLRKHLAAAAASEPAAALPKVSRHPGGGFPQKRRARSATKPLPVTLGG
jgi:hypothetical protein